MEAGFLLDQQWHWMRGEMETTKKPALAALVRVLDSANVSYAIIGGVAVQVHHPDPRTTLVVDVAVLSADAIPRDALIAAGFKSTGSFKHSENWAAENGTPVQFTDDPSLASAVRAAEEIPLENVTLRVIRVVDLVRQKLRAGSDPARLSTAIQLSPRLASQKSPRWSWLLMCETERGFASSLPRVLFPSSRGCGSCGKRRRVHIGVFQVLWEGAASSRLSMGRQLP